MLKMIVNVKPTGLSGDGPYTVYKCSKCNSKFEITTEGFFGDGMRKYPYNYCPICGARAEMSEDEKIKKEMIEYYK